MGVSTFCIIRSLWLCKVGRIPRGLIYWMPTDAAVSDFAKTKIDSFISENQELVNALKNTANTSLKRKLDSNTQGLKYIYGVPFFVRGLKSKTSVKSISADAAIYDEFDEADPEQVTQARKRLSASTLKISIDLSTPTIPDFGIDKRFQETDQRHYAFQCKSCSKWNILEENWPNTFAQDREGNYYPACAKCKSKLDVTNGTWFSTQDSKIRGYHISQLYSPFVSPNEIMHEYQNTEFMGHFYNHVLGLPYLASSDRITAEMLFSLCDPLRSMPTNYLKPTCMGVDVGSKLHVTILDPADKKYKLIHIGEYTHFEELDTVMLKYNVREVVFDALPETRKVREFIARQKYKSWMCYYSDHQRGSYAWNEESRIVSVNRTESMDFGTEKVLRQELILPQRNQMIELFANHFQNVAKVPEDNKETGERRYTYKKIGPDHFRHSCNYAMIAASRFRSGSIISVFR